MTKVPMMKKNWLEVPTLERRTGIEKETEILNLSMRLAALASEKILDGSFKPPECNVLLGTSRELSKGASKSIHMRGQRARLVSQEAQEVNGVEYENGAQQIDHAPQAPAQPEQNSDLRAQFESMQSMLGEIMVRLDNR